MVLLLLIFIAYFQVRNAYEKVGEATETALVVLVEKLNVFNMNLSGKSKADLAHACNNEIASRFEKVCSNKIFSCFIYTQQLLPAIRSSHHPRYLQYPAAPRCTHYVQLIVYPIFQHFTLEFSRDRKSMSVYCTPQANGPSSLPDKGAKMFVKVLCNGVGSYIK